SDAQATWQAVFAIPSFIGSPLPLASSFAICRRCTQNEHFSITPRLLTVTSGFNTIRVRSSFISSRVPSSYRLSSKQSAPLKSNQLKRRTLYGQLLAQYFVPIQRL